MTASCPDVDLDLLEPPEIVSLCASIEVFTSSLTSAHPTLLSRDPVSDLEVMAFLLHMHLDECRHLLRTYDCLTFGDACWSFDSDGDQDDEQEEADDDGEDIPF